MNWSWNYLNRWVFAPWHSEQLTFWLIIFMKFFMETRTFEKECSFYRILLHIVMYKFGVAFKPVITQLFDQLYIASLLWLV